VGVLRRVHSSSTIASGAECAQAMSGACDITREELIHQMKKFVKVVERVLSTEPAWKWS
jgi:hypothetical protein